MIFLLVIATRKLKSYFQAHPIKILTSQSLRKVIKVKNQSSRVKDSVNQLFDYRIDFEPRLAIKTHALADFIAECTSTLEPTNEGSRKIFVDGLSSKVDCDAGLLVLDSKKSITEHAVKFEFTSLNNEAKYEALLLGLQLCETIGDQKIKAHSNSQLIIGQVTGDFKAKEDSVKMYLKKTKEEVANFSHFTIIQIPQLDN